MDDNSNKILTLENLNPCVISVEYAVRGPLLIRAMEIEKEMASVYCTFLSFGSIFFN